MKLVLTLISKIIFTTVFSKITQTLKAGHSAPPSFRE